MAKQRCFFKVIVYICGVLFIWLFVHTLYITIDGLIDDISNADVAIVLGNKVESDGTPSERLKGRLDRAIELYNDKYVGYVLVSGGTGKEGFNEAVAMKNYLLEKGVPDEHVIVDQDGYNTFMTAQNAKSIMNEKGFDRGIIVSQFYHITRTKLAFRKSGFGKVYSAHAKYFELRDIYSIIREFFAYYKYLLM